MRYPLLIGNWKLNGNRYIAKELIYNLRKEIININKCIVVIAPPEIYLDSVMGFINKSKIILGAQNVDINLSGAFTGETSAEMLKDIGVKYVIIGHSERRIYHKESDKFIAKKFSVLKKQNLIPVLCIGETKIDKESGNTKKICAHQLDLILEQQGSIAFKNTVIAYEPVWAIGTGKSASPIYVQEVHSFIRKYISKGDIELANQITIQYGGSVNINNAKALLDQPDIDGLLIGSSSLKANIFSQIIKIAESVK